ncbi:protein of unknown function [Thermosyntropha lipolytica DSM 11003]|uniref:DUF1540 domain-containing protein n=1 Tax=Thermosyntropha lipolytica DSM 11003 TaxID=1123382 RepID=A0A1M5R3N2_9FIRM|nr:DUF1540 domain-containing protein [Thermosyntropha lipolytica]SHH20811.1 protein of unknown function [Thermosyntropha lipolytica DSM 11003]
MKMNGKQTISCSVSSCKHYDNNYCKLQQIQVSPISNVNSGCAEDENYCASYEKK